MSETKVLGINLVIDGEERSLSMEQAKELYDALGEIFGGYSEYEYSEDDEDCDCFWCRKDDGYDLAKEEDADEEYENNKCCEPSCSVCNPTNINSQTFPPITLGTWSASFDTNTGIYTFSTGFSNVGKG